MPPRQLTGDLEQRMRLRLVHDFKSGHLPILVATDVALPRVDHVEDVSHVINYDLPQRRRVTTSHPVWARTARPAPRNASAWRCEEYVESLGEHRAAHRLQRFPVEEAPRQNCCRFVPFARTTARRTAIPSRRARRLGRSPGTAAKSNGRRHAAASVRVLSTISQPHIHRVESKEEGIMFGTIKKIVRDKGFGFIVRTMASDDVVLSHVRGWHPKSCFEDLRDR